MNKNGKSEKEAYDICRRRVNKGNWNKYGCIPACEDTDAMSDLSGDDTDEEDGEPSCSDSCSREFENCHRFHNAGDKNTCEEAYNICRKQLDDGFNLLANAGCIPKCSDTETMGALKDSCNDSDDDDDSDDGDDDSDDGDDGNNPPTGSACTAGMVFSSNNKNEMQILCESNICQNFQSTRGDACRVKMDIPRNCAGEAGKSCSLLFFFHGAGGNNDRSYFKDQVHDQSSGTGFIGIYPQGVDKQWNTGSQGSIAQIDEGMFVEAIVSSLEQYYNWNGLKFAVGFSNGAAQTNRMAVNSGYGFDGVVASATQLISSPSTSGAGNLNQNTITEQTRPIPYLSLHGSADTVIPANGGELFNTGFILSSVADTLKDFATLNDCSDANNPGSVTTIPAVLSSGSSSTAALTRYQCDAGLPVEGVMVDQGGHGVARTINGMTMADYIFDWLLSLRENI